MRPVVTRAEMRTIEKQSQISVAALMDLVGLQVADFVAMQGFTAPLIITGPGNNGGDGYTTGIYLQKRNISCRLWEASPTNNQHLKQQFIEMGGKIFSSPPPEQFDCIIDALFGIGYRGEDNARECHPAIDWMNSQNAPILSIDIPSGLDCDRGKTASNTVKASATLYCHFPKWGMFLQKGLEYTGRLHPLNLPFTHPPSPTCNLIEPTDIPPLPKIAFCQNKYSRGASIGIGGSFEMPGAAILAAFAALKIGSGITRLLTPKEALFASCPPEVIRLGIEGNRPESWLSKLPKKMDAAFIGPGIGRQMGVATLLATLMPSLPRKIVIDADALYFFDECFLSQKQALLTPHEGEMAALLKKERLESSLDSLQEIQAWIEKQKVTLLLKGAPTLIFHPNSPISIITKGTPALATAGSGDVLTGILTGLLAQGLEPLAAALLGSWLHGRAGEIAAVRESPYSVTASSLFDPLSEAIKEHMGQFST